ncbi:MAG TPA: beta-ketoacyl synthase N-terminal-like domain-containing protein, partial [Herpetosiphonaceae bacterium]
IANTQIHLLDAQQQPLPVGVPGELYIGGVQLARGYRNRPALTAERFLPDPFSETPGARLYRTGDRARYRADGSIEFLGRTDDQVKLRGYRVELGEIEASLRQHPDVRDAVVLLREDRPGDRRLVAYVTEEQRTKEQRAKEQNEGQNQEPRTKNQEPGTETPPWPAATDGYPLGAADRGSGQEGRGNEGLTKNQGEGLLPSLRSFLRERLPEYMLPGVFVTLDALPLTANGKVDRRALPVPEAGRDESATPLVAPRSGIEQAIAAVWQDVLGVERVGVHDNFFDLGGHSLLLAQVHTRLRELLRADLALVDLFRYPTISALAAYLAEEQHGAVEHRVETAPPIAGAFAASHIAIIGMDGRFPGAANIDEFWHNLCASTETISFFSDEELLAAGVPAAELRHPNYVKARGILRDIDLFDAEFFGITPREAQITDPQQRLFLECAWNALERAGYDSLRYAGRIGMFAGAGFNTYLLAADRAALVEAGRYQALIGNDKDFLPTRVSYKLNLRGPSVNVQTACSSSLVAVHLACQSLRAGESDMVLAGGVTIGVPHTAGYLYEPGGTASPDGHCRAFDAAAQGMVFSSGVGVVVLKRLDDALRDGDTIHAVIRGSAINNDGAGKIGYTAPSVDGQAQVIADALRAAQVDPASIGYVEAHGTGTPLGDPIEVAALNTVFQSHIRQTGVVALGSAKTNIGHADAAAGIAGLIKAVLALKHRQIPPSLHFESPNPQIDFAHSPFYVNTDLRDWTSDTTPRRAGVSSFGIGGTNAHVVLEEAPTVERSPTIDSPQLLVLSARSETALDAAAANLAAHLRQHPDSDLADVAYTLQVGRRRFDHRRVLLVRDRADAIEALETCDPQRVLAAVSSATERPVAMLFPGQGAQYVNMGRELYATEPIFREAVDRCCEQLIEHLDLDLRAVLYPPDDQIDTATKRLTETRLAQPALFVIEYALAQLWIRWGLTPQAMIGHSIGEYVAATLASVFSLEDALKLVAARGRLMQSMPTGAMLSVALPEADVLPLLPDTLSLAAVNGAALCVVAGPDAAIDALQAELAGRSVESRRLHTSHAFHSAMLEPIVERFAEEVRGVALHPPQIAYISNLTGTWISADDAQSPAYWSRHLRQTVRFDAGLQTLLSESNWLLLEVGPGHTLSTLARQSIAKTAQHALVASLRGARERATGEDMLSALAQCWLAGTVIDWAVVHNGQRRRVPLPTYPFERQRYWIASAAEVAGRPSSGKQPDPGDWFFIPFWKPSPLPGTASHADLAAQRWLVFDDGSSLAQELIQVLRQHGTVTTVTSGAQFDDSDPQVFTLRPQQRADYDRLIESLAARGQLPQQVVHLWSLTAGQSGDFAQAQRVGYASLLNLAQALGRQIDHTARISVIANQLHSIHADEPIAPEKAPILGACIVIPQEYAALRCRTIDVVVPSSSRQVAALTKCLLNELLAAPSDTPIAYRSGQRWEQTFEAAHIEAPNGRPGRLRDQGVYLIAGRLSPIELLLASYLARTVQARLVLAGPVALSERESWDGWLAEHPVEDSLSQQIRQLQALEQAGAQVLAVRADVADATSMREVIADVIERFGALHGVFYMADNTQLRHPIREFDEAAYLGVFAAQAAGAAQFAALLGEQELDFALILTANAGLLGGPGLAAAVAGTRFIAALAHEQQRGGDWHWIDLSLDLEQIRPDSAQSPALDGDTLTLLPEDVSAIFERVLNTESVSRLVVSPVDLHTRLRQSADRQAARDAGAASERSTAARSTNRPYVAPQTETEQTLASIWQHLLGIEPVGIHDDYFELGGHSLLATQIVAQIQERLGVRVPVQQLFELPTIALLAAEIERQAAIVPAEQPVSEPPADTPIAAAPRDRYRLKRAALSRQSATQQKPQDQQ